MCNILKFNQVIKEYEQKEIQLKDLIKQFDNHKLSEELIVKYYGFSNYPFGHYNDDDRNNIQNKWNKFEPRDSYEFIPLIKIGEFKNWIDGKYPEDIPVLFPLITQDKEIQFYRNLIFRNCKNTAKIFRNIILRLITSIPPKQIKLHLIDNVLKGESFIDFTLLSNLIIEDSVIYKEDEIYKKLQILHDKVISLKQSMSTKYNNIDEYNKFENRIKEPYNFLFISNFPKGFNKNSLELLNDIMKYGNKVGFEVILDVNYKYALEENINIDEFLDLGFLVDYYERFSKDIYKFSNFEEFSPYWFDIEKYELNENIVLKIIESINNYLHNREIKPIDFRTIIDNQNQSSSQGIKIPIGYMNDYDKKLYFDLTKDAYHCIIGGTTGSGKTVLLHTIINSLSYHYSPDEIELYLLDYKEGTEFKTYENLAHCSLLSIASDVVFGISVLEKCLSEIETRGKLFKEYGVSNITDYKKESNKILPRLVIIVDEFQVLLTTDSKTTAKAKQYIDDIVRRGRSFGIHLVLSTQTLQGVELLNSTKSNTGLRIALKMNPEDASKILSDKNAEKPIELKLGEAIYNNSHGHITSDKKFQVAYIEPNVIKQNIIDCNNLYKSDKKTIIYNGNKEGNPVKNISFTNKDIDNRIYVGEANFLSDDHKYFTLEQEYGENILICGTNVEDAIKINVAILYSILLMNGNIEIYNFNFLNKSNQYKNLFKDMKLENNDILDLENVTNRIYEKLEKRKNEEDNSTNKIILSIFNIQNARKLYSESSGLNKEKNELLVKLHSLINDGSEYNIHILIYSPMYQHLENFKIKHINFSTKLIVNGGDSQKLIGQTIQNINIKDGNTLLTCNTNQDDYEEVRLYNLEQLEELINAK